MTIWIIGSKKGKEHLKDKIITNFKILNLLKASNSKINANEKWKYFNQISSFQIDIKLMGRKILRNKKINWKSYFLLMEKIILN
jgi:hypothetical protein